jgi:magnesium chelatase family protein
VLFLDELPEFNRHVLEVLRVPMETGKILISRAARQAEFPARFQLVAAMNPCPCGMAGADRESCNCSAEQIQRYCHRVSGPLLDRIDIQIEVLRPTVPLLDFASKPGEETASIRARVVAAHEIQMARSGRANARLDVRLIQEFCKLGSEQRDLLELASEQMKFSPRACHRVLKVSRTIADLDASDQIETMHLTEAIALRRSGVAP